MASDHRKVWVLGTGDRIECADTTYIITGEPIGYGGSAIVYPARSTDTHLNYAIKECFPRDGSFHRVDGVIRPTDSNDPLSGQLLEHFCRETATEQRLGQLIHNAGSRAVCIRQILNPVSVTFRGKTFESRGSGFALLDRMDLKSVSFYGLLDQLRGSCTPEELKRTQGLPSIHTTACLMEEILLALQQVHSARDPEHPEISGYYFGDLHGGNIHFTGSRIREGVVGSAHLIDFGSTRELDQEGFTVPLLSGEVFSAEDIRPPEMLRDGLFRLSRGSDLFSAGCLMLRCVATEEKISSLGGLSCTGPDFLSDAEGAYIGCGPDLLKLVNEILDRATAHSREARYSDTEQMLAQIRALKAQSAPMKNQLGLRLSTLADGAFVGRDSDRRKLDRFLDSRRNPIILHGFPGMGKTELAIDYGRRKSRSAQVYFVRFSGTFRATIAGPIADAFSGYSKTLPGGKPKPEKQIVEEVLHLLGQCAPDDMLIIDHVDNPSGDFSDLRTEEYRRLCALPMHLMLTTRSDPDGEGQWHEVGPLERRNLYKLMEQHVRSIPREQLDQLIDAVQSHTLTLDLMARTMAQSWQEVTPQKLLDSLRAASAGDSLLPEISTTHDRSSRRARLHGHLKALFDLSGMTEEDRTVLCCATLLPTDGMNAPLFKRCLRQEETREQEALVRLTRTGWLTVTEEYLLCIHPVIREICKAELVPNSRQCGPFLQQLWKQHTHVDDDIRQYEQMAGCFAASLCLPGPRNPYLASYAGMLFRKLGQYQKTLEYAQLALDIGSAVLPKNHPILASFYGNLGTAFGDLGRYEQEFECHQEALRIRKSVLPPNHPDLAVSYSCLGTAFGDRGNPRRELEYQQNALQIRLACLSGDHPDLADSYDKVGSALCAMGEYPRGEKHLRTALRIRQSILPDDHPLLAVSHNNLSKALCGQGRHTEALEHLHTALQIRQRKLPALHPAMASTHQNLAYVYSLLHNPRRELEHYLQCLKIRRELLRGDDPLLIATCRDVAKAYGKLREHDLELEYFLQALEMQRSALPEDHPDLIQPYCHVAAAYRNLGQQEQQRIYLRKAAQSGHVSSMTALATQLLTDGAAEEAVYWLDQAARRGNASAANNLGLLCLKGMGCIRDPRRGMRLLQDAAGRNSQAAHRHLGRIYLGRHPDYPEYFPADPRQALHHLLRARELGAVGDESLIRQAEDMLRSLSDTDFL